MSGPPEICIVGIDPGISGAVAFYFPSRPNLIAADDVPVAGGDIDAAALARRIHQMQPDFAVIERVASRPGQGVASVFRFGAAYGAAIGVLGALAVPVHFVTPGKWKRHFGLGSDKEESRARAIHLWPASLHFGRKKDHGRAEAGLLARYGAEVIGYGKSGQVGHSSFVGGSSDA